MSRIEYEESMNLIFFSFTIQGKYMNILKCQEVYQYKNVTEVFQYLECQEVYQSSISVLSYMSISI